MTAQPEETSRIMDMRNNCATFIVVPLCLNKIKNGVPQQGGVSGVRPITPGWIESIELERVGIVYCNGCYRNNEVFPGS
jgi:hypothetical protein